MKKEKKLTALFLTFLKIGAFTFGGGYAMISIMEREVVEKRKWVTKEDISEMLIISESTPGVLSINAATFIGYRIGKFKGALLATLGAILPSLILISIIAYFLVWFQEFEIYQNAVKGITCGVAVLITTAVFKLGKNKKMTLFSFIIIIASFLISFFLGINVLFILLGSAILGVLYGLIKPKKGANK
ncbi:chromate transporter [Acholeplasma sp. OttesenSCG-928-E16]|nr:chromate transporter [Acholeplasma sp. OttesenSCG-928-E16]